MRYLIILSLFLNFSLVFAEQLQVTKKVRLLHPTLQLVNNLSCSKVTFDIEIEGEKLGQIVIGLFGKIVPKTVKNFVGLCRPNRLGFKGSKFCTVCDTFIAGGDYSSRADGTTGFGAYYSAIEPENFILKHCSAGWVSMFISNNMVDSRFLIFTMAVPRADNLHVVFGKVIKGMNVVRKIQTIEVNANFVPLKNIIITNCTVEKVKGKLFVDKSDSIE